MLGTAGSSRATLLFLTTSVRSGCGCCCIAEEDALGALRSDRIMTCGVELLSLELNSDDASPALLYRALSTENVGSCVEEAVVLGVRR